MEKLLNLYNTSNTLSNNQLRKLIRSEEYKGYTSDLSKNMLQTNPYYLRKNKD